MRTTGLQGHASALPCAFPAVGFALHCRRGPAPCAFPAVARLGLGAAARPGSCGGSGRGWRRSGVGLSLRAWSSFCDGESKNEREFVRERRVNEGIR